MAKIVIGNNDTNNSLQHNEQAINKEKEAYQYVGKLFDYIRKNNLDAAKTIENFVEELEDTRMKKQQAAKMLGAEVVAKYKEQLDADKIKKDKIKTLKAQKEILEYISKQRADIRAKDDEILQKEVDILKAKETQTKKEVKAKEAELRKLKKEKEKEEQKQKAEKEDAEYGFGSKFLESFSKFTEETSHGAGKNFARTTEENLLKTIKGVGKAISDGINAVNNSIKSYAKYQTGINARLQGTSSFSKISKTLNSVAYSPLIKAEDLYSNVAALAEQGIVSNIEQRAFLQTTKEGIATTFNAMDESLRRMIRIQQTDSTAARLGMEGYLTRFLNTYVENTEYLTSTFDNVASSLLEASAMLGSASKSLEFEETVQKWLGTLTGLGLSNETAQNLATAIGQLGSGDVEALSGSNMQNLLVMAANRVNLQYGELLTNGLDAHNTNKLMRGVVEYLQELGTQSTNVVKNQLSKIFGVTVSDLVAVTNLKARDLQTIFDDQLSYQGMYSELGEQFNALNERVGIANILDNLFSNLSYQNGMNIGANPATFALWKIADMIKSTTGGINIPYVTALGTGVDIEATADQLMKLGIVGVSTLSNIGKIIKGVNNVENGSTLLAALGIDVGTNELGGFNPNGIRTKAPGFKKYMVSGNTYVGNENADDYYQASLNAAEAKGEEKVKAKMKNYKDPVVEYFDKTLQFGDILDNLTSNQVAVISVLNGIGSQFGVSTAKGIGKLSGVGSLIPVKNNQVNNDDTVQVYKGFTDVVDQIALSESKINENLSLLPKYLSNRISKSGVGLKDTTITAKPGNATKVVNTEDTNVNASLSNSAIADIGNYLAGIQFEIGFKSLVDNVADINEKLNASQNGNGGGSITGITLGNAPRIPGIGGAGIPLDGRSTY